MSIHVKDEMIKSETNLNSRKTSNYSIQASLTSKTPNQTKIKTPNQSKIKTPNPTKLKTKYS